MDLRVNVGTFVKRDLLPFQFGDLLDGRVLSHQNSLRLRSKKLNFRADESCSGNKGEDAWKHSCKSCLIVLNQNTRE
jgi:hypothetical protein